VHWSVMLGIGWALHNLCRRFRKFADRETLPISVVDTWRRKSRIKRPGTIRLSKSLPGNTSRCVTRIGGALTIFTVISSGKLMTESMRSAISIRRSTVLASRLRHHYLVNAHTASDTQLSFAFGDLLRSQRTQMDDAQPTFSATPLAT